LNQLSTEANVIAAKPGGLSGTIYGSGKAIVGLAEMILHIDELPGAIAKLLTDSELQALVLKQLGEKLEAAFVKGEAVEIGELVVEIPLTVSAAAAAPKAVKLVLKVSKEAGKAILKQGLKGKELIRALLKADREAVAAAKSAEKQRLAKLAEEIELLEASGTVPEWKILEMKAMHHSQSLGQSVIESQYMVGASPRGFDFLSFSGKGKDAKLYINEVKNWRGDVPANAFTALGTKNPAQLQKSLEAAENAIKNAKNLDPETKTALLAQLYKRGASGPRIRLYGNSKTTASNETFGTIESSTGLTISDFFLLP
jgi:hypothetical protein